jgi:hypothetical protein
LPSLLNDVIELVSRSIDIVDLRRALENITPEAKTYWQNREITGSKMEEEERKRQETILNLLRQQWLVKFSNEHLVNDRSMFRFLKSMSDYSLSIDDKDKLTENDMRYIIEKGDMRLFDKRARLSNMIDTDYA